MLIKRVLLYTAIPLLRKHHGNINYAPLMMAISLLTRPLISFFQIHSFCMIFRATTWLLTVSVASRTFVLVYGRTGTDDDNTTTNQPVESGGERAGV